MFSFCFCFFAFFVYSLPFSTPILRTKKIFDPKKIFGPENTVCKGGRGATPPAPLPPLPPIVEGPEMNLFFSKFAGWSLQLY